MFYSGRGSRAPLEAMSHGWRGVRRDAGTGHTLLPQTGKAREPVGGFPGLAEEGRGETVIDLGCL